MQFEYDAAGRQSAHVIAGGLPQDVRWDFTRNPAGQIASETRSNDSYAWTGHYNIGRSYTANGLNQYTVAGSASFSYDANGNLTSDGTSSFTYDPENRLVAKTTGGITVGLRYDPLGRLYETSSSSALRRYLYDRDALVAVYDGNSGAIIDRYVHGPTAGVDDPLVHYQGSLPYLGYATFLYPDTRGSIVQLRRYDGSSTTINRYDEYGIPQSGNAGAFQYTGQIWLPEIGLYYYKARMYSPTLGRFMQTDPIGYADGMNWYNYVKSDPVNATDPSGRDGEIVVTANKSPRNSFSLDSNAQIFLPGLWSSVLQALDSQFNAAATANRPQNAQMGQMLKRIIPGLIRPSIVAKISPKIAKQMQARGWTQAAIDKAVSAGPIGRATNRASGNSASVYGSRQGYVVVDDVTGDVVQISNRADPRWIPDSTITFY